MGEEGEGGSQYMITTLPSQHYIRFAQQFSSTLQVNWTFNMGSNRNIR